MLPKLGEGHGAVEWHAVAQEVQVRRLEIDDSSSRGVLDKRVMHVPLLGDRPVQYGCARGHFMQRQWDPLTDLA